MYPKTKNKLVLIAGGTSSGKTTITMEIAKRLACFSTVCLSMDNYYRHLPGRDKEFYKNYDFDRPEAIEGTRFAADLKALAAGEHVLTLRNRESGTRIGTLAVARKDIPFDPSRDFKGD